MVTTPNGFIKYEPIEKKEENNPLQKHLSGWSKEELERTGFAVYGQGAKFIYAENGLARKFPSIMPFWFLISLLFSPIIYFMPKYATYLVAVKKLND